MNLAIDKEIFAHEFFSQIPNIKKITLFNGRNLTNKELKNSDALFVRSVTPVNESLLKNTNIHFVATATSGTNHLDLNYLKENKIFFSDAKGANSDSVVQYVFYVLLIYCWRERKKLEELSIAIVGCGKVGSKLCSLLKDFEMNVYCIDPFVKGCLDHFPFEKKIDIISLHCSLVKNIIKDKKKEKKRTDEEFSSYNYINKKFLKKLKKQIIIINTSRGEVINENDLLISEKVAEIFSDVWQNEPNINSVFLKKCQLATPHIAGYTLEAKLKATKMVFNSFCDYLKISIDTKKIFNQILNTQKKNQKISFQEIKKNFNNEKFQKEIRKKFEIYHQDHHSLLKSIERNNITKTFDERRKDIINRRQFFFN